MSFEPIDSSLLFSRNDPNDPRLGDIGKLLPEFKTAAELNATLEEAQKTFPNARHTVIAGYPDDEGIRFNGGRLGANQAPPSVRKPFYKMTPSLLNPSKPNVIWDLGDLRRASGDLPRRHEIAFEYASATLNAGATWIGIGGGHDYGFPDTDAFVTWMKAAHPKLRPLVLNFDAHLDVRPVDANGISSGTPFYRLLKKHSGIDFAEIGIQAHCNSVNHLNWVREKGARVVMQEEAEASGQDWSSFVFERLEDWLIKPRPVFLSIDIDGFTSMAAPGCSQSWATGFTPKDFFPLLDLLARRLDVRGMGIYEVSPPLDQDDRTAKLAAQIMHRVLFTSGLDT
jgi:formiminoglutamase